MTQGAAIDEVNLFRTTHGLRPFKHDAQLTKFAQMKAEFRAARMLKNGHQGPQNPPGTGEGTAEAKPMWGWLSCSMEEDWEYAGAGVAIGGDGERYMVLVVRGGTGTATRGRNLRPVPTAHLTPDPPRFDRTGRRIGTASARPTNPTPTNPTPTSPTPTSPTPTSPTPTSPTPSSPTQSRASLQASTANSPLKVGQRDRDGAVIIRVGR